MVQHTKIMELILEKYFKENGYITGRVNSFCEKEPVCDNDDSSSIIHHVFDHEGLSLGCMKPFYDGALSSLYNCLVKKFLFGKDLNEYTFVNLELFCEEYINQNKMFLYQSSKFYGKRYLKDTAIILFSDHG